MAVCSYAKALPGIANMLFILQNSKVEIIFIIKVIYIHTTKFGMTRIIDLSSLYELGVA